MQAIVAMGLRFLIGTQYAPHLHITEASLLALVVRLLASKDATIFLAERDGEAVGMLAVVLYTQPMSGERIASELCWWMNPEARGGRAAWRLLHTAEAWAKDRGAVIFQMTAPNTDVAAFYQRLGFEPIELLYQRGI